MFAHGTLEYTRFAFRTNKGVFTLVGSGPGWIDEFRRIGSLEFYEWDRRDIKRWYEAGKITPIEEANKIDWL